MPRSGRLNRLQFTLDFVQSYRFCRADDRRQATHVCGFYNAHVFPVPRSENAPLFDAENGSVG